MKDETRKELELLIQGVREGLSSKRLRKAALPRSVLALRVSALELGVAALPGARRSSRLSSRPHLLFTPQFTPSAHTSIHTPVHVADPDELRKAATVGVKLIFSIAKSAATMTPDPKLLEGCATTPLYRISRSPLHCSHPLFTPLFTG